MKVVLAFDSWKESLTASEACAAAARGLARLAPPPIAIVCPLSDGGEGFVETLALASNAPTQSYAATGPLFEPVRATVAFLDDGRRAMIESAQVCGLHLVPSAQRSPGRLTTRGLGELVRTATKAGAKEVVIGLGGSATNDAGVGMLSALGWEFLDVGGHTVAPCGDSLASIHRIIPPPVRPGINIVAACDVNNPLFGPRGAAHVFAPQKGATADDVQRLDHGLRHFASLCAALLGRDLAAAPGAGAAGGLGFALLAFLGAEFRPGAGMAIELSGLQRHLDGAALCLTGEGRTDYQTAYGKLPGAVAGYCRDAGVPCVCLSGALGERWQEAYAAGFSAMFSVTQRPVSLKKAISEAPDALADAAEAVGRLMLAARQEDEDRDYT